MKHALSLSFAVSSLALGGCASTITAWKSRAFAAHDLSTKSLVSMTGDRRLAFFTRTPSGAPAYCMEALPDVATAFSASSKPNANVPNYLTLGTDDTFATTLTKTYDRSNETQFYRLVSFDNCMQYAMGVIDAATFQERMKNLTDAAVWYIGRTPAPVKKEEPKTSEKKAPTEVELLTEIRDLLKKK